MKVRKYYERKKPNFESRKMREPLHDKAPAYKSQIVRSFLDKNKDHVLPHSPYSPLSM